MSQRDADAGAPATDELTAKTTWPTIGAFGFGRLAGRLCAIELGIGRFFTLGKVMALATIPISMSVYAMQLLPFVCRRYVLTNRRVIIKKGYGSVEEKSLDLDGFDAIEVKVLPGQQWLHAGELVFSREGTDVFCLSGVSRPDIFRRLCLVSRSAMLSVREVVRQQA